jgi:hypothetical protein
MHPQLPLQLARSKRSHSLIIRSFYIAIGTLFVSFGLWAQNTGTTNISVTVSPEASIVINTSTTSLAAATTFANYTGSTAFTYKVRTSAASGSGNIQLEVSSDFTPGNGPSVASPPSAGDRLSYVCTVAAPATACSGSQNASTITQTPVASFGAGVASAASGNSGTVSWSLTNDPVYKPNSYAAVVTFTISAT